MFNLFKKNTPQTGSTAELKIDGMHCTSCSLNIDGELEDTEGVLSAHTSYAKGVTTVKYQPEKVTLQKITKTIEKLGYTVSTSADKG